MRIVCRHGHFAFYPRTSKDIAKFSSTFGCDLEREEDYFTFPELAGADRYSLAIKPWLNLPAITSYEGMPWDIMRENNFVYHLGLKIIVPKLTVLGFVDLVFNGFCYVSNSPLIQPGYRTKLGRQILSYSGELFDDNYLLRVLEFDYE